MVGRKKETKLFNAGRQSDRKWIDSEH
jgi:hypothetical protein